MKSAEDIACLAPFCEALGVAAGAVARCMANGVEGNDAITGEPHRKWLEEKLAHVLASAAAVTKQFGLDQTNIAAQTLRRTEYLQAARLLGSPPALVAESVGIPAAEPETFDFG
jgi:hypothetical protein